jgi:hypothetical protein
MMQRNKMKHQQRKAERHAKAEQLLREKDYSLKELAAALPYQISHARLMIYELMGMEGGKRQVFICGWDVAPRAKRGYTCTPRYRWVMHAEANAPRPDSEECRRRLRFVPAGVPIEVPKLLPSAHNDLMAALFGRAA